LEFGSLLALSSGELARCFVGQSKSAERAAIYLTPNSRAAYGNIADMPAYAYAILAAGWLAWMTRFVLAAVKRPGGHPARLDRRARWAMPMIAVAYALVWQGSFWARSPGAWRIVISSLLFVTASILSWTSTRALGRQWRLDAGLNAEHELVRSGPYRVVRHPIYTSMFCMLLGTGLLLATPLKLLLPAILLLAIGTEIRVRIEERLLASRFGDEFLDYQRRVPAYIPFLK
jgi:protein-S-isoprenylcysteine O-methyltransferase Ste14